LGWRGPEHEIYQLCRERQLQVATSPLLLAELQRVLLYPKLGLAEEEIRWFVSDLTAHASVVQPRERINIIQHDPSDNIVLECAVEAEADWIISGDPDILDLQLFQSIRILNASSALGALGRQ